MSKRNLTQYILVAIILGGATIYVLFFSKPTESPVECTTDYVNQYGQKDCENTQNSNEAESDAYRERTIP